MATDYSPSTPSLGDIMGGAGTEPTQLPDEGPIGPQGGYTVDDLLPGIQHFESGGRRYAVSPKGAIGLYQIMPDTAAKFGYTSQDMFDPKKNEDVARKYLGQLLNQYNGNAYMALAAYNSGPKTVNQGILYPETSQYVNNVLGFTGAYKTGSRKKLLASAAGRDISPRFDTSGPIDPSFRGTPVNQIFNRYGKITGDQPGYGGEQALQQIPQRPMATFEQGMQKVGPAIGNLFSPIGQGLSRMGTGIGNFFSRPSIKEVVPDPGEVIS